MLEAVRVALDPTPRQERLLGSHAGAARFAYNAGLAHVKDMLERGDRPEWSYYGLRRWWNQAKDTLAVDEATGETWWPENSKEAYNSGLESLADALKNFSKSRKGRRKGRRMGFPRFKSKDKAVPGFTYTTGSFGFIDCDPHALRLPKIGRVRCMEDVSKRANGAKVLRMIMAMQDPTLDTSHMTKPQLLDHISNPAVIDFRKKVYELSQSNGEADENLIRQGIKNLEAA